jgi:hypothetical protein
MGDGSKSNNPSFFFFGKLVALGHSIGIIKRQCRGLKSHSVFEQVSPTLILVPFETHGRIRP